MSSLQSVARLPAVGRRGEAAQDIAFRWLKKHIATLPRDEATFLTEAEVCRAVGTSRTPVREALLRLEADGLLKIVPKKGAYVPPIIESEIEAVMQARGLVEDWCVRQAARLGESLALELQQLTNRQEELRRDPLAFIESDREFHRTIVGAAGNPVLVQFYESLRDRQLRMGIHAIATSEQRTGDVLAEHAAIVEGVRSGDPDRAAAAIAQHLSKTLVALKLPIAAGWTRNLEAPHGGRLQR